MVPAEFRLLAPSEVVTCWPTDGWIREAVALRSRAAGHSRVVRHERRSGLGAVVTDSLLDGASHGQGGAALPCALAPAPRFSGPTVKAFRHVPGRAGEPDGERGNYYNDGEYA